MHHVHNSRGSFCLLATYFCHRCQFTQLSVTDTCGATVSLPLSGLSGRAIRAICRIGSLSTPVSTNSLVKTETFPSTHFPFLSTLYCFTDTMWLAVYWPHYHYSNCGISPLGTSLTSKRSITHIQNINFYNTINSIGYNHLDV